MWALRYARQWSFSGSTSQLSPRAHSPTPGRSSTSGPGQVARWLVTDMPRPYPSARRGEGGGGVGDLPHLGDAIAVEAEEDVVLGVVVAAVRSLRGPPVVRRHEF